MGRDFRGINGQNETECKAEHGIFVKSKNICANLDSFWKKHTLVANADGTWTASQELDKDGKWTAFFVHMEYEGPKGEGHETLRKEDDVRIGPYHKMVDTKQQQRYLLYHRRF